MLPAHQVIEIPQARLAAHHLEPLAAERVVDQELHHVARSKELVPDCQLPAVARGAD